MDGAMGTQLQQAGQFEGNCAALWNLTHPERVRAVHEAYVAAGAECLLTNTFQAHPAALARHGLQDRFAEIAEVAIALARAAAGPERFVLADLGPGGDEALIADAEQALAPLRAADGLMLETYSALPLRLLEKCKECFAEELSLLVSLTYWRTPAGELRTFGGEPPEVYARRARDCGLDALGVNCGREMDMDAVIEIVQRYREQTDLPLFARPNAGTPTRVGECWQYPRSPDDLAARLPELLESGVTMIGGCCGTTPNHVAAFRPVVRAWNAEH